MISTRALLVAVSLACLTPFMAMAATSTPGMTDDQFSAMLKKTLDENPEIILDAIKKIQSKQEDESGKVAKVAIEKHHSALFSDASSPSVGASEADADVTIVEFFDYHCGYCKHMTAPLQQLIQNDKKIRVVFKDFPILSQDSATAARAALAVNRIDKSKYLDFYMAAMQLNGKFDENTISGLADKIGVSPEKVKAEMAKKDIGEQLQANRQLGEELTIHGTPAFVINGDFYPGALSFDELQRAIDNARSGKKDS